MTTPRQDGALSHTRQYNTAKAARGYPKEPRKNLRCSVAPDSTPYARAY